MSLPCHKIDHLNQMTSKIQKSETNNQLLGYDLLNEIIEHDELVSAINRLKTGKAVSEDNIMNEFLINSNNNVKGVILKVFNECLKYGIYPWNGTIITPLHKKGDRYDPNNYRAIAVGSNIGKLF